jgi:CRP/FNR family transcriptional regulator
VYLIRDGVIKLSHSHQDGREVILGLSDRDRILGAATVILQRPHPVTAVTVTPCSIRSVSAQDFLQLIKTDPQFSFHLHRILCGEIYQQGARLADLSLLTARERLERLLDELVLIKDIGNVPDEVAPGLHLRHWELAELIAVTPEHLSRLLKLMHRDRNVAQENATVKVRNQRNVA